MRCALCEAFELAGPHFDFVVPVNDSVAGLEAAEMETAVLVDARIVVLREGLFQGLELNNSEHEVTYGFPQNLSQKIRLSCGSR
jgi:hypothetical protein